MACKLNHVKEEEMNRSSNESSRGGEWIGLVLLGLVVVIVLALVYEKKIDAFAARLAGVETASPTQDDRTSPAPAEPRVSSEVGQDFADGTRTLYVTVGIPCPKNRSGSEAYHIDFMKALDVEVALALVTSQVGCVLRKQGPPYQVFSSKTCEYEVISGPEDVISGGTYESIELSSVAHVFLDCSGQTDEQKLGAVKRLTERLEKAR